MNITVEDIFPVITHHVPFAILFTGILGGYLIADYPPKFLKRLITPLGQFFVIFFLFIVNGVINKKDNILFAVAKTIISVFLLQFIKYILFFLYK